jgi:DNA-binding MarR family transcriptional regulator
VSGLSQTVPRTGEHSDLLAGTITRLRRGLHRAVHRELPFPPLPAACVELLRVVEERPGIGVAAAAAVLQVAPNTVSTLVGDLVSRDLLARTSDPANRRAARLTLTETAHRRIATYCESQSAVIARALARLDKADRRVIDEALATLQRLTIALEEEGAGTARRVCDVAPEGEAQW